MNFRLILLWIALLPGTGMAVVPPPEPAPDAASAPPPMRELPQRQETLRSKALAAQLQQVDKETEVVWLGTGSDQYLALYRPDHSGKPFANLLVLHDNQQHPDWPGLVSGLRNELAAHGWNTLAIALPDYPETAAIPAAAAEPEAATTGAPPAQAAAPASADPASPASPDPDAASVMVEYSAGQVPDIIDGRAREAVAFLQQKAELPLVMVAIGLPATITAKKAQTMLIADIAGLVVIDPVEPASLDFRINLDAMDLRIPILDIAPQFDPRSNPALRRNSATRSQHELYEQRVINGAREGFPGMEPAVIKAIRGWGERQFKPR